MIEQTYKLNMIPRAEQDFRSYEPPVVHISQYDKVLRTLRFELYDGEDPFTIPENTAAYIYGMKPDGNAFQYQMDITEDGILEINVQTQMATVAGCVTCEVILFEGNESGNRIGSANFKMAVEKAAVGDDAQFSRSDMPVIQTLLFGGSPGDTLIKGEDGRVRWNSDRPTEGFMKYSEYDPDLTGTVNSARQANNAATVDGHTVARNVLAGEYTNAEIDALIEAGAGAVDSVNGKTGAVVLTASDLGAYVKPTSGIPKTDLASAVRTSLDKADTALQSAPVTSVNSKTGAVSLTASDLGAYTKPGAGIPKSDLASSVQTSLEKADTALQSAPVNSVNGKTGAVSLTASDVGALPDTTEIPSKTSDLTNDSGFLTSAGAVTSFNGQHGAVTYTAPVQSVNGETPGANGNVQIDAMDIETLDDVAVNVASGNPVTISDATNDNAVKVTATLEPIQDLNGYDHPWAGGAGKNLFNYDDVESISNIENNNGTFTNTAIDTRTYFAFTVQQYNGSTYVKGNNLNISASGRYSFLITVDSAITRLRFKHNGSSKEFRFDYPFTKEGTFCVSVEVTSADPTVVGGVSFKNVMIESGSTMTAYEPYSNICPITGITNLEIANNGTTEVTVNLGQTVYGGTLNVSTGELTVETANIASYNGETIGEPWLSSMDEYVAGATPTTGAQVVYTLATPQTYQLTTAQIQLLTGTNIITTNADDLFVRYYASGKGNVEGSLTLLFDKVEELEERPTATTYTLSMSGNVITLTPSSGTASSITLPVYAGGVTA